jgi:hypothetical protein
MSIQGRPKGQTVQWNSMWRYLKEIINLGFKLMSKRFLMALQTLTADNINSFHS